MNHHRPPCWLGLNGGAYARFTVSPLPRLTLGRCGRGGRGNAFLEVCGRGDLLLVLGKLQSILATPSAPTGQLIEVYPWLCIMLEKGTTREDTTLDIVAVSLTKDRTFSLHGLDTLEALTKWLGAHLEAGEEPKQ